MIVKFDLKGCPSWRAALTLVSTRFLYFFLSLFLSLPLVVARRMFWTIFPASALVTEWQIKHKLVDDIGWQMIISLRCRKILQKGVLLLMTIEKLSDEHFDYSLSFMYACKYGWASSEIKTVNCQMSKSKRKRKKNDLLWLKLFVARDWRIGVWLVLKFQFSRSMMLPSGSIYCVDIILFLNQRIKLLQIIL